MHEGGAMTDRLQSGEDWSRYRGGHWELMKLIFDAKFFRSGVCVLLIMLLALPSYGDNSLINEPAFPHLYQENNSLFVVYNKFTKLTL